MSLTVQPLRFTDNIDAMTRLLTALGMSVSVTSDKGGWVVLSGRTGTVALHTVADASSGAQRGQTSLSFEATELEQLAQQLTAAGFGNGDRPDESMVYDEAYGHALTITVGGEALTINAAIEDLYGYSSTGVRPGPGTGDLHVTPIRFVDDQAADRRLLEALGFSLIGEASPDFTELSLPDSGGSVGLHPLVSSETGFASGPFAVQLHFSTTTPLTQIIERAASVGIAAQLHESEFGDHVTITDPDGQQIQVHTSPA